MSKYVRRGLGFLVHSHLFLSPAPSPLPLNILLKFSVQREGKWLVAYSVSKTETDSIRGDVVTLNGNEIYGLLQLYLPLRTCLFVSLGEQSCLELRRGSSILFIKVKNIISRGNFNNLQKKWVMASNVMLR